MKYRFLTVLLALSLAPAAQAHDEATARYLGNEGVLVSNGETKVLFDAFYAQGFGQYMLVPEETRKTMMAGDPPYDGIDAVFVSHVHGDHFAAEPMLAFLRAHPTVRLYASTQVKEALDKALGGLDAAVLDRVNAFDLRPGDEPQAMTIGDVAFDVVAIPHAGGPRRANIQNLVFRVSVGAEATVMHMGDAAPDDDAFAAQQAHWNTKTTQTAFPPYWFLFDETGRSILDSRIRAEHVIGVHVPSIAKSDGERWRGRARGDLFTDPDETRTLGAQKSSSSDN